MKIIRNYFGVILTSFFLLILMPLAYASAEEAIHFTTEQVENGKLLYRDNCQICHGSTLSNGQFGTPLRGSFFRNNMSGKSLGEMLQFIYESMPPDKVMSLTLIEYAEITAFILERNRLAPDEIAIGSDYDALKSVLLPW